MFCTLWYFYDKWILFYLSFNTLFLLMPSNIEDFSQTVLIPLLFVIIGLTFKLGTVPFHYWIADVYQGSYLSTTAIFAMITKIPILIVLIKLHVLLAFLSVFQVFFFIVGLLSFIVGVGSAMYEVNFKRFSGFSAISHIGYIMVVLSLMIWLVI